MYTKLGNMKKGYLHLCVLIQAIAVSNVDFQKYLSSKQNGVNTE
jgi:hypothetical protein